MVITCRQLAQNFGIDYLQASSIIKMLLKAGAAQELDSIKKPGRGRPTVQYAIPELAMVNFADGTVHKTQQGSLNA